MSTFNSNEVEVNKSVGIIGCGWLGTALAKTLLQQKYFVVGTTQHSKKLESLEKIGMHAELLSLPIEANVVKGNSLFQCRNLVICIPPQIRHGKGDYANKMAQIVSAAEQGKVEKIVLISTTAIYGDLIGDVDESTSLNICTDKVALLFAAEQRIKSFNKQSIILRAAGLVGENRHPGAFLRHKRLMSAPNAYVNLVHQQDVVGVIVEILSSKNITGVFNLVSQMQVSKKHFYSIAAGALHIEAPEFDDHSAVELGKQVMSNKVRNRLHYKFQYDDLVTWAIKTQVH